MDSSATSLGNAGTGTLVSLPATLIRGDGIGPEVTEATLRVLDAVGASFDWDEQVGGVAALESEGSPLPDGTVESIRRTRLALKGPLTTPVGRGFRSVNVALRKEFALFANVRPVKSMVPGLRGWPPAAHSARRYDCRRLHPHPRRLRLLPLPSRGKLEGLNLQM